MNRAYSLLTVKSIDEDKRIVTGIATTPTPDRMGDVVEPEGAEFKLPLPLLWQHDSSKPIGHVTAAKVSPEGISITAQIESINEPGTLKDRLDEAWQSIKKGLVRGLSIGFKELESARIADTYSYRYMKWLWLELSTVTIAANGEASIQTVKSADSAALAASGSKRSEIKTSAGVTAKSKTVKAKEADKMKKTVAEQISAFEETRKAKSLRMDEIMDEAADTGATLDDAAKEEYDGLADEVKEIDEHLVRLRAREQTIVKDAAPVKGATPEEASKSRTGVRVQVRGSNVPQGIGFVRLLAAKTNAYLSKGAFSPLDFVKARPEWQSETPEVEAVLKAAVSAGTTTDTTWAAPLVEYQNLASEFVEYLRPLTIIGRIPGLRNVPFKVKFPRQTGAATASWVGESKPKPATSLAFDSLTMDPLKVAGIVPLSMELMRFSSPSAEMIIRDDLAGAIAQLVDNDFVDPDKSASANVSPASITYGVTPTTATGTTYAYLKADVKSTFANFLAANITPDVTIMSQAQALAFSLMETTLGVPQFPGLTMNGGPFMGTTAIASENIPYTEDSPQEGSPIIFLRSGDIALADDGGVEVDVSTEASIEMSTTPADPVDASTVTVSLWQHNLVGVRAERMINWTKRRAAAVQYISAGKYA